MTDLPEVQEETANPYNMRKDYSVEEDAPFQSADGVYHEPSQATRKAPDDKESSTDYKKRYDDLKKHYDSKISEFKQKEKELQAESRMTQQVEQAVSHEDRTEEAQNEAVEQPTEALEPVRTSTLDEREARVSRKEAEQTLASAHPDFSDIRQSEEFHGWAKEQPEAIQDWVYNNPDNVGLAVKAIDLYKMETGLGVQSSEGKTGRSQTSTSSAADMVSTKTTSINANEQKIWSQREIAALSMNDYDKYEQEIDSAIMEGRVVA
jgi:hypothetical protein